MDDKPTTPTPIAQLAPPQGVSDTLWAALVEDLVSGSNHFSQFVIGQLREPHLSGDDLARWPVILRTLRQHTVPSIGDLETMVRLEDRLHQAERLIAEREHRAATPAGGEGQAAHLSVLGGSLYGAPSLPLTSDLELTQRIVSRLQQAPDTESVLRVALEELGSLLGARVAVARLGTRKQLLAVGFDGDES
jgi:hypothetical protein